MLAPRIGMVNAVGAQVPRMARTATAVTRIGKVKNAPSANEVVVTVGGKDLTCDTLRGQVLSVGDNVLVVVDRGRWVVLGAAGLAITDPVDKDIRLYNDLSQSIPHNAFTWLQVSLTGAAPYYSWWTMGAPGRYLVQAAATFAGNATGGRTAVLMLDGAQVLHSRATLMGSSASGTTVSPHSFSWRLNANQQVGVQVYQNSGAALNTVAAYANALSITYLGP